MFQSLSDRLSGIFEGLTRRGALSEKDVSTALREVRRALIEADVALEVVRDFTDRIREKAHFARCAARSGVAPAPYAAIETEADLTAVPDALLPGILKTARLGYDGKGQARVASREELAAAWRRMGGVAPVAIDQ